MEEKDLEQCIDVGEEDIAPSQNTAIDEAEASIKALCAEHCIFLNTENLSSIEIDKELFAEGVKSVSKICGAIAALNSVGVSTTDAFAYVIDTEYRKDALKNNLDIASLNSKSVIESSRFGKISAELKEV